MKPIVPAYYQVKQTIRNWITNGEYSLSERLPSENTLAKKFDVSRLTIRQAIAQLTQEGWVDAQRGKGTFVTDNCDLINSSSLEFTGFLDDIFYQVAEMKAKSVEMNRIMTPRWIKSKLNLNEKCEEIVEIRRVRMRRGKTFAYTINYLPLEIASKIVKKDLYSRSLLEILEQDLGIQFTEAFESIEASFADQELAEKLRIPNGLPIISLECIMYTKHRKPVEFHKSLIRGDSYKYIVRLRALKNKHENIWVHQDT